MLELFAFALRTPEFRLADDFVATYQKQQPAWGPVGYVTYKRTYARTRPDGRTEEWVDTCRRVVEGCYRIQQRHCQMVGTRWNAAKAQQSAQTMFRLMWNFKFLPPGRGLWMMGTDFVSQRGGAALNNCAVVSTASIDHDFADPFCFLMDMSMLGVGVGGDCRGIGSVNIVVPVKTETVHVVEDTREGWVDALRLVLNAYVGKHALPVFDYSKLRPAGAPIRGFGGVAAGAEPLRQLLEVDVPSVLNPLAGQHITTSAIVDLFNFVGKCVVAGNVRRTAEIMFSEPEDEEFLDLKNPELHAHELRDRRWASNNSVFAHVGMDYLPIAERIVRNGEPGLMWLAAARAFGRMADQPTWADARIVGANPCLEQSLEHKELCCLVENFIARHASVEEFLLTLKYSYLYAKTVTLVPTHDAETNAVMMRNRRIGSSLTGLQQAFVRHGRREVLRWCDEGYQYLTDLDREYSEWLAVPVSRKRTSVKPSGTVTKLPGGTCGIHHAPAEYYIQRIRFAEDSPLVERLAAAHLPMEPCKYSPRTIVVEFPVHEPHFGRAESDVSLWEQLADAAAIQRYWADNQVSCTIKFDAKRTSAAELAAALSCFEDQLKGISFLPHEHGYEQAPWEPITKEEYERRVAELLPLDLSDATHDSDDRFCDGGACRIAV